MRIPGTLAPCRLAPAASPPESPPRRKNAFFSLLKFTRLAGLFTGKLVSNPEKTFLGIFTMASTSSCDTQPPSPVQWLGPQQMPMIFVTMTNTSTFRAVSMKATMAELGVQVDALVVQRHPRGSVIGIFDSHVKALRHMSNLAKTICSPLFLVFEDDIVPSQYYRPEVMETIIAELVDSHDDFDIAYFDSIQWFQLLPYFPPWHRTTLHTLDHAWSTMTANVYTRGGLAKVLPILEVRLAEMLADNASEPQHVDLFLESDDRAKGIVRRQIVPYMFDQNWLLPSGNVDRCDAKGMECSNADSSEQAFEQAYLREGVHISWSNACFEAGGNPVRFYLIFIPTFLLATLIPMYFCYRCYRSRTCCFACSPPDAAVPSEGSALLAKT